MAPPRPTVLTNAGIADLIHYVLDNNATASTMVICSIKEAFIEQLLVELRASANEEPSPSRDGEEAAALHDPHGLLQQPTLRMLAASQKTQLDFCPDITHLRAYLSTYSITEEAHDRTAEAHGVTKGPPLLAILNPIELHRPTSAYSAQGLNRTFSLAVEAAHHSGSQLLIAECPSTVSPALEGPELASEAEHIDRTALQTVDPWDKEVSILNVTTKSFSAGGRGWVGRTVAIRRVAERWFSFKNIRPL